MMQDFSNMPALTALVLALGCTATLILLRTVWALGTRKPVRSNRHLVGRRATVYWHSPSGLQDERGITARRGEPAPELVAFPGAY